jgi:hypothetical protein
MHTMQLLNHAVLWAATHVWRQAIHDKQSHRTETYVLCLACVAYVGFAAGAGSRLLVSSTAQQPCSKAWQ